jgi:hypothetical protein
MPGRFRYAEPFASFLGSYEGSTVEVGVWN